MIPFLAFNTLNPKFLEFIPFTMGRKKRVSVVITQKDRNLLHAIENFRHDEAQKLLNEGANHQVRDNTGATPLLKLLTGVARTLSSFSWSMERMLMLKMTEVTHRGVTPSTEDTLRLSKYWSMSQMWMVTNQ